LIARVLIASFLLAGLASAAWAQTDRVSSDIRRAITSLQSDDRVQRALGAIAIQHVLKGRWRFSLLDRTHLRWWQTALQPAIPALIEMLTDDAGLEWVDQNGMTEQVTTPRKEATLALIGLERAAVDPLIASLDRPGLTRKADQVLRRITDDGPSTSDRASWQRWWTARQTGPLPGEHGQLWKAALALLLLAGAIALVIWRQRRIAARTS
jgi:thioesterase domain-containing protein